MHENRETSASPERVRPVREGQQPKPDMHEAEETDFRGFSYGFRPGRGAHQALDALSVGILRKRVNWILDADIRSLLRQHGPRMDDEVRRASCGRQPGAAADP